MSAFREIGALSRGYDDQVETFWGQNSSDLSFSRAVDIENTFYFCLTPNILRDRASAKVGFFSDFLLMLDLGDYLESDKNKMCFGYLLLAKSSNPRSFDLKMFLLGHCTP